MPEFKERPKMDKPKTRPTTIPPKQAARILSEKYRRQLDQRPEGSESETTDAADQVEGAGRQTVGEVTSHRPQPRNRQNPIKQKEKSATSGEARPQKADPARPKTRPQNPLKAKEAQEQARPRQPSPNSPRQRITPPARKEAASQATSPAAPVQEVATPSGLTRPQEAGRQAFVSQQRGKLPAAQEPPIQSQGVSAPTMPQEAGRQTFRPHQQSRPRGQLSASGGNTTAKPPKTGQRSRLLKERPRTVFKTKASAPGKTPGPAPKVKPATKTVKAAKQTAQRHMRQQAVARARQTAKAAVDVGKKVTIAVAKAVASLVGSLVGLLGGSVLLVLLIFIVAIAAVANSPFGIFFSGGGRTGGSSVPTVSVSEAVSFVNMEYNARLEQLQAGSYDGITLAGQAADWPDVLAVFAARYAAAEDGVDVATLDADRVSKLTATFWDMTVITSEVESIHHADSDPDDEIDDSWTERILHITATPKNAEEMKTAYSFTDYQISALDELLADPTALASLAGSLEITNADVRAVLNTLPEDLSVDRKRAVETALQLVGKVNYFWGGKSYVMGWDNRWGQLAKVTSNGSPTTGTYRPYGLDCSGFIDWALRNAGLPSDGHWYVGTNLAEVTQADALPGDMALYPDDSHIGMVVGRDGAGKLLICHCSSGNNNVVVTEFIASGFTALGRPGIYGA